MYSEIMSSLGRMLCSIHRASIRYSENTTRICDMQNRQMTGSVGYAESTQKRYKHNHATYEITQEKKQKQTADSIAQIETDSIVNTQSGRVV